MRRGELMQLKITQEEYQELQKLAQVVQDRTKSFGQRRIAKAQYNRLYSKVTKRNKTQLEYV
jgi:hypothetical protein